jgi:hypothetical protein
LRGLNQSPPKTDAYNMKHPAVDAETTNGVTRDIASGPK